MTIFVVYNFKLNVGYDQGDFFSGDIFGAGITLQKRGVIR
jgi:hypothetical protein